MNLSIYQLKPDQGRITRGVAFWLSMAMNYYGCRTLYYFLSWEWAKNPLIENKIPIINLPLNIALILSVVIFIVLVLSMVKIVNAVKFGNLLIETETEMKKVTWPSFSESFNSSIVVLIAVIFFLIYLYIADIGLELFFRRIVFGG